MVGSPPISKNAILGDIPARCTTAMEFNEVRFSVNMTLFPQFALRKRALVVVAPAGHLDHEFVMSLAHIVNLNQAIVGVSFAGLASQNRSNHHMHLYMLPEQVLTT